MRYIQPQILKTENANVAIQSVCRPDNGKPIGPIIDCNGTRLTTPNGYEADE